MFQPKKEEVQKGLVTKLDTCRPVRNLKAFGFFMYIYPCLKANKGEKYFQLISVLRKLTCEIICRIFVLKSFALMKKSDREIHSIEERNAIG